jgi:hypothetical protein
MLDWLWQSFADRVVDAPSDCVMCEEIDLLDKLGTIWPFFYFPGTCRHAEQKAWQGIFESVEILTPRFFVRPQQTM